MEARERLARILEVVVERKLVSPGDVVTLTGLPRYSVLAMMQCLEALGVVEAVYSKGTHRVYAATPLAEALLKTLKSGEGLRRWLNALKEDGGGKDGGGGLGSGAPSDEG